MDIQLYTSTYCPFCVRAKALLDSKGLAYTEHVMDGRDAELRAIKRQYGHSTVPIVVVDGRLVGGSDELQEMADAGELD
jgi:glutaredoxin 3